MRSKQLLFCVTAAACIAIAADASAETRHNTSKSTGAATATTHAGPNTIHANQQNMSGMRANAGNRNFSAEERVPPRHLCTTLRPVTSRQSAMLAAKAARCSP
jgi:hypothetical protein